MDDRLSGPVAVLDSRDAASDAAPTQLDLALRRRQTELGAVDPQAPVARFGSAF